MKGTRLLLRNAREDTGAAMAYYRGAGSARMERRQRRLLGLACATAVVSVGVLIASTWVKSPAEVAASMGPPKASVITAPVSYLVLRNTVVFRGTFSAAKTISFTPTSEVAPSGSGPSSQSLVVSRVLTRPGARLHPGQVIAEVSDRPIFVLTGQVPAFRDMVQGDSGRDIVQLQTALDELGYSCAGDMAGVFGPATADAVRQFYAAIGYAVPLVPGTVAGGESGHGTQAGRHASQPLVEVPMAEAMFVPSFPASVASSTAQLGAPVSTPLLVVTVGGLRLSGQLDPTDEEQIRPGMRVQVMSNTTGKQATGVVATVGKEVTPGQGQVGTSQPSAPGSTGSDAAAVPYVPVEIRPVGTWANSWEGQNVQLTVTSATTSGPVLAVPEAAITSNANADTSVTVVSPGGHERLVRVRPGASAGGLVQVTPIRGRLASAEMVVVGT